MSWINTYVQARIIMCGVFFSVYNVVCVCVREPWYLMEKEANANCLQK